MVTRFRLRISAGGGADMIELKNTRTAVAELGGSHHHGRGAAVTTAASAQVEEGRPALRSVRAAAVVLRRNIAEMHCSDFSHPARRSPLQAWPMEIPAARLFAKPPRLPTMLILNIDEARPGAKLAMGVMHPEQRSQELLRAGFCLDATVIARLKDLGVQQVFVDFPGLDDLDKYVEPFLGPERQKMYAGVKAAIGTAEREGRPIASYDAYYTATREFISLLITRPENRAMLDLLSSNGGDGGEDVAHATRVAHLALVIGLKMEAYLIRERPRLSADNARDVTNLGVAGMLHDVGKCKMRDLIRKRSVLTAPAEGDDRAEWESHPRQAYDLIRNSVETTTAAAVLHHHQRFDGTGFPQLVRDDCKVSVAASSIHPFARILAAADLFDRLSVASDGRRRTNYEVHELINTHHSAWLDPVVLATLPQVLPPFSPGRRVTLSDRTHAIVTGFNPKAPYLPAVKRIRLEDLQLDATVVDLRDFPDLKISEIDGRPLVSRASPAAEAA